MPPKKCPAKQWDLGSRVLADRQDRTPQPLGSRLPKTAGKSTSGGCRERGLVALFAALWTSLGGCGALAAAASSCVWLSPLRSVLQRSASLQALGGKRRCWGKSLWRWGEIELSLAWHR